ncbi:MAG: hypothetical protein KQH59_15365 [Desulfobulbaceae bacterium]|nr:hypothetical protein [Desulfobulbaceae bacterium]
MKKNHIEMTGKVSKLRSIKTKRDTAMAKWLLEVGEHKFNCVAFAAIADAVLAAGNGTEIGVSGTGSINSWQTDDGAWRNDFRITVWTVEVADCVTVFSKQSQQQNNRAGIVNYFGGPF